MAAASSVHPNRSRSTRRTMVALALLLVLYIGMPWAARVLERWMAPAAAALAGQAVELALAIALGTWVFALIRREQRVTRSHASELERLTETDALTGLGNPRAFTRELDLALNRARRTREAVSVLLLDLDDADVLSGRRGRAIRERTLRMLGAVLRSSARFGLDNGYRLGDGTFAMVLSAGREAAEIVARRLEWNFRERTPRHSRLSAGLATWNGRSNPHEMLLEAERALQVARHSARLVQFA